MGQGWRKVMDGKIEIRREDSHYPYCGARIGFREWAREVYIEGL